MPELTANTHTELFLKAIAEGSTTPEGLVPENHLELWLQKIMEMGGVSGNYVRYTEQELSAAEEAQARDNIGAAGMEDLAPAYDSTVPYKVGNLLSASGKMYLTIKDAPAGTPVTNTEYFEEKSVADIIEMIKQGAIVTGHSQVADNLTPYSEDSGTTQENPFISQGTGTDNNSVIVTTGAIARQLEKQGNTVPVMQLQKNSNFTNSPFPSGGTASYDSQTDKTSFSLTIGSEGYGYLSNHTSNRFNTINGHKYLISFILEATNATYVWAKVDNTASTPPSVAYTWKKRYAFVQTTTDNNDGVQLIGVSASNGTTITGTVEGVAIFDITSWNSDIITDLTSHPEHFSWYYNGSLAYDAGSLQNCNGRYLECGQGRNLFGGTMELGKCWSSAGQYVATTNNFISTSYKAPVVPNTKYAITCVNLTTNNLPLYIVEFDNNKNFISRTENPLYMSTTSKYKSFTVGANTWFIAFQFYKEPAFTSLAEVTPIDLSKYYTPEEGGEGYNQHYDYVAPIRIDTGNETLKAFDKKLPSGVITDNTLEKNLKDLTWGAVTYNSVRYFRARANDYFTRTSDQTDLIATCSPYSIVYGNNARRDLPSDGSITFWCTYAGSGYTVFVRDDSISTVEELIAKINGTLQVNRLEPITTQGDPYSEYADINDYSYMAWFDTDGNLVSIPQGCKLFYPVDYKGFVDDLVMYTNGDATALAKEEDIADAALNARGYYKMQVLLSPLTDAAGLTYDIEEAMKIGNLVSLTIRATNLEETSISSGDPLFTLASDLIPAGTIKAYANVAGSVVSCTISNLGSVSVDAAIAQNETVAIILTYAV